MEGDALLLGGFLENFTFQSTPSVWRETSRRRTFPDSQQRISIHSLRMEGDFVLFEVHHITCYFNPLPPYGGRRLIRYPFSRIHAFQSTPSVWRETRSRLSAISQPIFQSTPSVWRETVQKCLSCFQSCHFNPLPPYGGRRNHSTLSDLAPGISIHSLRMEGDRKFC